MLARGMIDMRHIVLLLNIPYHKIVWYKLNEILWYIDYWLLIIDYWLLIVTKAQVLCYDYIKLSHWKSSIHYFIWYTKILEFLFKSSVNNTCVLW